MDKDWNLTEMFMARAGNDRDFIGVAKRSENIVHTKIKIYDEINTWYIYSSASNNKTLGKKVNELSKIILDSDACNLLPIGFTLFNSEFIYNMN